ncbi:MAG: hypothetical protein HYR60_32735 [Acidobacteria bacterium]|nr:hypothetical protein [Acidobacteriota bacterium]
MSDAVSEIDRSSPEFRSGVRLDFSFPVKWDSVTAGLRTTGFPFISDDKPSPVAPVATTAIAARSVVTAPAPSPDAPEVREWEMVLPRVERPPSPPAPVLPAIPPPPREPVFDLGTESALGRRWRETPLLLKIVLLLSLGTGIVWKAGPLLLDEPGARKPAGSTLLSMGEGGWFTEWASDAAGSQRGRQLTLYRPSLGLKDYAMDFRGVIDRKSLGWVFRAADSANYYAVKIEIIRPGSIPEVALTRLVVVKGVEVDRTRKMLPVLVRNDTVYQVRLDAMGPKFALAVQGQAVDFWTDDRLKSGGVGFLNEREERARIVSFRIIAPSAVGR